MGTTLLTIAVGITGAIAFVVLPVAPAAGGFSDHQRFRRRFPRVLQTLAGVRKSVGVDGPQQLLDYTAPPVDLRAMAAAGMTTTPPITTAAISGAIPASNPPALPVAASPGNGLSVAQIESELTAVPEPQRKLAAMLPLADLPAEWTIGKSGEHHIESFNADNLYEKIDGRAESFIQYGVKGMAYAFYHPTGDPSNELQLYVFEMSDPLKALGKYGSENPTSSKPFRLAMKATRRPEARSFTPGDTIPRSFPRRMTPSSLRLRWTWQSESPFARSPAEPRLRQRQHRNTWRPLPRDKSTGERCWSARCKRTIKGLDCCNQAEYRKAQPDPGRGHSRDVLCVPARGEPAGRP